MIRPRLDRVVYLLFVILSLSFQKCSDSGTGFSPYDLQTIIPLKVGASWTYLDITPSDVTTFPDDSSYVSDEVITAIDSAGGRYYMLDGYIGNWDSANYYESVTATSYLRYQLDDQGRPKLFEAILRTPIKRGSRWFANGVDNSNGYSEIANPDTTVTTPAGTWSGVIYVRQAIPHGSQWFIKPQVGIVYETRFSDVTITRKIVDKNF